MTIVQSAAVAEVAIGKQASEGTGASNPVYALPVYSGLPGPTQAVTRFNVTDTANTYPGLVKTDIHWEADLVVPAFPASAGAFIVGILPTDTKTGAADPYTHTFTPAGNDVWQTLFSRRPGDLYEKFVDGLLAEMRFEMTADEPLKLGLRFLGKTPSALGSAYTATTTEKYTSTGEYFTPVGGSLKLDEDTTPAATAKVNIVGGTIRIARQTDLVHTAEALTPGLVSRGRYEVGVALDTVWQDFDAYRATYFGSTGGTTASSTIVMGSIDFTFACNGNVNHSLQVQVPNVALLVPEPPAADPGGAPFKVAIDGMAVVPAAGSVVTVVLKNAVSTAYTA